MFGHRHRGGPPDTEYYDLLQVPVDASEDQIKTAYKKLARQYHPDRYAGKSPEEVEAAAAKFKDIAHAYGILGEPSKRAKYDAHGKDAERAGSGRSPFGGIFGEDDDDAPQKGKSLKRPIEVTLADLYTGKTLNPEVTRNVICSECKGSGANKPGLESTCKSCRGNGVTVQMVRQGFTIFQQQVPCEDCDGEGTTISEEDKCEKCHGERLVEETKKIKVEIEKGMTWGQKMCYYGEGDEQPDGVHGDLYFQLVPPPDAEKDDLQRDGNNLIYQKKISLIDALCGCDFIFEHLDGRKLLCSFEKGEVVQTGDKKKIPNQGMPLMNKPEFGHLYLLMVVEVPKNVTPEQLELLKSIWPPTKLEYKESEVTKVQLAVLEDGEEEDEFQEQEHEQEGPSCVQS